MEGIHCNNTINVFITIHWLFLYYSFNFILLLIEILQWFIDIWGILLSLILYTINYFYYFIYYNLYINNFIKEGIYGKYDYNILYISRAKQKNPKKNVKTLLFPPIPKLLIPLTIVSRNKNSSLKIYNKWIT